EKAVGLGVRVLHGPANRTSRGLDRVPVAAQWGCYIPPFAAGTDYAFCKGANAGLGLEPTRVPPAARGPFGIAIRDSDGAISGTLRLSDVTDGTAMTIALGEAVGG